MIRRLADFEAWAIFATVAEQGSFARAAQELGLSNPTVSKAIARLEARLGIALLARTSRRLSLTEAGRAALDRAARILHEGEAVESETAEQSATPRGRVRLSAPLSFGIGYLASILPAFLRAYPDVALDLSLSDRQVDLVAEGFDIALRIARLGDSSLVARRLCSVRLLLVASPAYLDAFGRPTHPAELARHRVLAYSGGPTPGHWHFTHPQFGEALIQPPVRMWADNADILVPALLAGDGMAIQPEFVVWREVRDGALEVAMPNWTPPPLALHLIMPPSPLRPLRVKVLVDHLAAALARAPWAHIRDVGRADGAIGPPRTPS